MTQARIPKYNGDVAAWARELTRELERIHNPVIGVDSGETLALARDAEVTVLQELKQTDVDTYVATEIAAGNTNALISGLIKWMLLNART